MASKILSSKHLQKQFWWEEAEPWELDDKNQFEIIVTNLKGIVISNPSYKRYYIEVRFCLFGDSFVTEYGQNTSVAVHLLDYKILSKEGKRRLNAYLLKKANEYRLQKYPQLKFRKDSAKFEYFRDGQYHLKIQLH